MHIIESPGIMNDRNRQVWFLPTTPITQFAFLIWLTLYKNVSSHSIYNGNITSLQCYYTATYIKSNGLNNFANV